MPVSKDKTGKVANGRLDSTELPAYVVAHRALDSFSRPTISSGVATPARRFDVATPHALRGTLDEEEPIPVDTADTPEGLA